MITLVVILILLALVGLAALAVTMMWLVKARYRDKAPVTPPIEAPTSTVSKTGRCSRCGEQRIIVSEIDVMCASCYSALRTKTN